MTDDRALGEWPAGGEDLELKARRLQHQFRQAFALECARCVTSFALLVEEHFASLATRLFAGVAALPESPARRVQEQWVTAYLTQLGRQLVEQHDVLAGHLQQLLAEEAAQEPRQS